MFVAHTVLMAQRAGKGNGYDFHVFMGMGWKPHGWIDDIVVEYSQQAKVHPLWIMVVREAESVVT